MSADYIPSSRRRPPVWMIIVIIVAMLPVLSFPALLAKTFSGSPERTFVWLYPIYVIASGVCAWICWPERKDVCWILIALMLMSHAAIWLLVSGL